LHILHLRLMEVQAFVNFVSVQSVKIPLPRSLPYLPATTPGAGLRSRRLEVGSLLTHKETAEQSEETTAGYHRARLKVKSLLHEGEMTATSRSEIIRKAAGVVYCFKHVLVVGLDI
jgi:hypothetical protein